MNNKKLRYGLVMVALVAIVGFAWIWTRGYDYPRHHMNDWDHMDDWRHMDYHRGYGRDYKDYDRRDKDSRRDYPRSGGPFGFASLDENRDGEITREEAEGMGQRIFADFDSDKDEQISQEEFIAHSRNRAEKFSEMRYYRLDDEDISRIDDRSQDIFNRLDEDEDGAIDPDEFFFQRIEDTFNRLDRNEDGIIDRYEYEMRRR